MGVELLKHQLERLSDRGQVDELVEMVRARAEPESFSDYERRARDLFTQQMCRTKLDLAIAKGISQENQTISSDALVQELDNEAQARGDAIRQAILTELDL